MSALPDDDRDILEQTAGWSPAERRRLIWRLSTDWSRIKPRPNQLTPDEHALCQQPREACEAAVRAVPANLDPLSRTQFLADRGHVDWLIWLLLTGRGWGKTRVGAEDMVDFARKHARTHLALVGATLDDVRKTMVEGESGILESVDASELLGGTVTRGWNRGTVELWFANGTKMQGYTSEKPNRLRGPQHHRAWCDELAAWENLQDTWDNLMFGLRLGSLPQVVITTTPKPKKLLIDIKDRPTTIVTTGHTFDNAHNLAPPALAELKKKYEGTRVGAQELAGNLLEEVEGALWSRTMIEIDRIKVADAERPDLVKQLLQYMRRVVVGVDPAMTSHEDSDETGIIVAGLSQRPCPWCRKDEAHGFIFADYSGRMAPLRWAKRVKQAYDEHHADRVVAERNQGGELVKSNLVSVAATMPIKTIHAKRGKNLRAQPVVNLYEQHKVHHVGAHNDLEDQQCTWEPDGDEDSPDHLDACVYALSELMVGLPVSTTARTHNTALDEGR